MKFIYLLIYFPLQLIFHYYRVPSNITIAPEPPKTPAKSDSIHPDQGSSSAQSHLTCDRRLRSHGEAEPQIEIIKQENMSSMASTSSECSSTPHAGSMCSTMDIFKSALPLNIGVTKAAKLILDETFAWKLLPSDAPGAPCMIYGAIHLTRLLSKFLNFN